MRLVNVSLDSSRMFFLTLKSSLLGTILLSVLLYTTVAVADLSTQKSSKLAVVNVSIIMKESPRAKSLTEEIKNKYLPRQEALAQEGEQIEKLKASLDQAEDRGKNDAERIESSRMFRERNRKYTREYEDFRDQLTQARQNALTTVRQEVDEAINTVREKYNIDIVIDNYVSASDSVDITQAVIDYLEQKYKEEKSLDVSQATSKEEEAK